MTIISLPLKVVQIGLCILRRVRRRRREKKMKGGRRKERRKNFSQLNSFFEAGAAVLQVSNYCDSKSAIESMNKVDALFVLKNRMDMP